MGSFLAVSRTVRCAFAVPAGSQAIFFALILLRLRERERETASRKWLPYATSTVLCADQPSPPSNVVSFQDARELVCQEKPEPEQAG